MEPGFKKPSKCTIALQHWSWKNDLLLNPDKSDLAFYGTRPCLKRLGLPSSTSFTDCAINVPESLKILAVTLDATPVVRSPKSRACCDSSVKSFAVI